MKICLFFLIFEKQTESHLGRQSAANISIMKNSKQISKCFKDFERGLQQAKLLALPVYCPPIFVFFPPYSL